jgi:hypothetical protein
MVTKHQAVQGGYQGTHQRGHGQDDRPPRDLKAAVRNNYFYGKLLDVFHLEMEQEYFNSKRWLLNRLVTGPGVVCGLKVELTDDEKSVQVLPGLAIDRCGREIIVPTRSAPFPLPEMPPYAPPDQAAKARHRRPQDEYEHPYYCEIPFAHVVICYHECKSDPVPALAGDCDSQSWCASGSVREQYSIEIKRGFAPTRNMYLPKNVIEGNEVNYGALVDFVTGACRPFPDDCCIPLVNVELKETDNGWQPELDNRVTPIVYTNRLLYQLINSLMGSEQEESEV